MSQWLINSLKDIIFVPVKHSKLRLENIPQCDEQFKNIERLKQEYTAQGNPVLSMDVKKELIGNFFRSGKLFTKETVRVNNPDFVSLADGKVIPHGLYDINRNVVT